MKNIEIVNDKASINITFSTENEIVILLANYDEKPNLFKLNADNKIVGIELNEIKSAWILERINYVLQIVMQLLKINKDFEYINDFIEDEILV